MAVQSDDLYDLTEHCRLVRERSVFMSGRGSKGFAEAANFFHPLQYIQVMLTVLTPLPLSEE